MNAAARIDIGRLARICGLFSSEHDSERAAAAAKADAIVHGAGMTWPDVLVPSVTPAGQSETSRRREVPETSWRRELTPATILSIYGQALTGWERCFLQTMVRRPAWTDKQRVTLREIQARFS